MTDRIRLVHVCGPLQALTASSVVLHLQERDPMQNVLVFGTGFLSAHDALFRAARECAAACRFGRVLDIGTGSDLSALQTLGESGAEVAELVLMHNYMLHQRLIEMFPNATRTVYGDALGLIDVRHAPGLPAVDRIVTPLPQPRTPEAIARTPWEAVPRALVLEAAAAARAAVPGLRAADRELAEFSRGGVLVLTSNLAGSELGTTPRGECGLVVELVERSVHDRTSPVLLKPHPRATLGHVSSVARELRRSGHAVRVWSQDLYGSYPIELFTETLQVVDSVRSIASSATVSLAWLYGIRTDVDLDRRLAARTIGLWSSDRFVRMSRYYDRLQRELVEWRGEAPLPAWPPMERPLWRKAGLRLSPLGWKQVTTPLPPRVAPWLSESTSQENVIVDDTEAGLRWHLGAANGHRASALAAAVAREGDTASRLEQSLDRLTQFAPRRFALTAAVLPPSHLPRWRQALLRRRGVPVVPGAALRAAQVEEILERRADVLEADELRGGVVRFTCHGPR
jgi:hypothetical protein